MAPPARTYDSFRRALSGRVLPLAWVDLDAFDRNADTMVQRARPLAIRLASKSVRCLPLMRRVFAKQASFRGVLAYNALEAVWLASEGLEDIVVAYPTTVPAHIEAVCRAIRDGAQITLSVDCVGHVHQHAAIAERFDVKLPICLDLDMSTDLPGLRFGVFRSPIRTAEEALDVAGAIGRERSLVLDGVLAYEAQIAGIRDAVAGQNANNLLMRALKHRSMTEVTERRAEIIEALRKEHTLRFVNGGGTGSLADTASDPSVTELAAGSGLFAPALFDGYRDLPLVPAAGFVLPVTRIAAEQIVTCMGGGYVASGPSGADRQPTPMWPAGAELIAHEGGGEVQTPLRFSVARPVELGDPVIFRHAKAGELCERFEELVCIEGERVALEAPTYRGSLRNYF
jgi:D-serine deaminase-like pyridoxal phosphate-dependent protein